MTAAAVVTFDLDYYAFSAWQLHEAGRMTLRRLKVAEVQELLDELERRFPGLKEYRDPMTHALDDKLEGVAWFGEFAAELLPGGNVRYIIDSRYEHHDALEDFFAGLVEILRPLGSGVGDDMTDRALEGRPAQR